MGKIKQILIVLVLFFAAQVCFANQISFQIVQHDDRTDKVSEDSYVVEDELLNGFFETGYIITNSPTVVSDSEENDQILYNKALGDAYEGSSDYFIQIVLYYTNVLKKAEWTISSAKNGKAITKGQLENTDSIIDKKSLVKFSTKLSTEITGYFNSNGTKGW